MMLIPVYFHKLFLYIAATISVFANGILLALLLNGTSKPLGNYKILLCAFALFDIFISLFHAWYIPMFILGDYGYVFFGYGTLMKSGTIASNADFVYSLVFFAPFSLLCLHFIYRYCSLARPATLKKRFSLFIVACASYVALYVSATAIVTVYATKRGLPARMRVLMSDYHAGTAALNTRCIDYLNQDGRSFDTAEFMAMSCAGSLSGHTIVISLVCIRKIAHAFDNKWMTISIRRLHLHLFRALLIQFAIPIAFSLVPMTVIFVLPVTGVSIGQWGNLLGLLSSLFPALDPVLIILSIGRFRSTLMQWVDALFERRARRNEMREEELSKAHFSMKMKRMTRSST